MSLVERSSIVEKSDDQRFDEDIHEYEWRRFSWLIRVFDASQKVSGNSLAASILTGSWILARVLDELSVILGTMLHESSERIGKGLERRAEFFGEDSKAGDGFDRVESARN
jgi:hypothetical protein